MGQELPCRCSQRAQSCALCITTTCTGPALPSSSTPFGMSLTLVLSMQGLNPAQGCWDEAFSTLQGTWVINWDLKQQVGGSKAPTLLLGWNNPSPLCVVLTSPWGKLIWDILTDLCVHLNPLQHLTEEMGCPSEELNELLPEVLSAPNSSQGETQPCNISSETSPSLSPCSISSFFPRHTLEASAKCRLCAGAGRMHEAGAHKSLCGTCAALAENKEERIDRSVHSTNTSTQKRSPKVKTTTCFIELSP